MEEGELAHESAEIRASDVGAKLVCDKRNTLHLTNHMMVLVMKTKSGNASTLCVVIHQN